MGSANNPDSIYLSSTNLRKRLEMSWIKTIPEDDADAALSRLYKRVKGPGKQIDNVLRIHSLRPHTLTGHMTLYKSVLHSSDNSLPKWYLEALGVYVSHLNGCDYCQAHHLEGMKKTIPDPKLVVEFRRLLDEERLEEFFDAKLFSCIGYLQKLTLYPASMEKGDIIPLRESGFTDAEILEINQLGSYFNYVNRTVNGLGVALSGEELGLSPDTDDNPADWEHR